MNAMQFNNITMFFIIIKRFADLNDSSDGVRASIVAKAEALQSSSICLGAVK